MLLLHLFCKFKAHGIAPGILEVVRGAIIILGPESLSPNPSI